MRVYPRQPGYKSQFTYDDSDYFSLAGNDVRIATAHREQRSPTMEQVKHVIATMPCVTEIELRNRALMAFTLLTGARVSAMASMRLQHIDFAQDCVHQDARQVKTKFRKTFTTYFLPVGNEARGIVEDWVQYLRKEKLFGNDDPLFPATRVIVGAAQQFEAAGLDRKHWKGTAAICKIFREAFEGAGQKYFHPHSFRHTLVRLGQTTCKSPEEFMAWAQNIGHDGVLTAFFSYGVVACQRQGEIMRGMGLAVPQQAAQLDADGIADAVLKKLRSSGVDV